jgi:hypothetical protein
MGTFVNRRTASFQDALENHPEPLPPHFASSHIIRTLNQLRIAISGFAPIELPQSLGRVLDPAR